jgi:hypothetical protein
MLDFLKQLPPWIDRKVPFPSKRKERKLLPTTSRLLHLTQCKSAEDAHMILAVSMVDNVS